MSHLQEAQRIVNNWVNVGRGQAGFEWQSTSLVNLGSRQAAAELASWWARHPHNPANTNA